MEVTQKLQPVQDEACNVFEEIDGQGSQLDQVVATVEERLEGPITEICSLGVDFPSNISSCCSSSTNYGSKI
jgi:hypothetical protein